MEYPESARNVTGTHEKRRRWRRAVSVLACAVVFCTTYALILPAITLSAEPKCGLEEHTHTEDCYETRLVCGQAEGPETDPGQAEDPETDPAGSQEAAGPAHVHTDACYEQVLTCEKPEHTHTDACWSDPAAAEDPKDWEPQDLTGDWNRDTLAIALAQEGYRPSEDYFTVDDTREHIGYTRYGDWSGDPFGEWNLSFAAFCLHFAGAAAEAFPVETSAEAWRTALDALDLYQPLEGAIPGDLIFLDSDGDGAADRVGIFTGWQEAEPEDGAASAQPEQRFAVMEGNLDGEAAQAHYDPEDAALLGRASPDEAADAWYLCGKEAHIHGDDCYDGTGALTCGKTEHIHSEDCQLPESRSFTWEDDDLSLTVTVLTPAPLPEDVELTVTEEDASTLAAEDADTEESGQWLLRGLALTQNGQALEIADCRMTAEVALTERVFAPLAAEAAVLAEDAAPEAEVGVVLSAWQADEDAGLQEVESVLLEEETATLTVPVENGMLALYASSTTNPQYKVQYYAYIPRFATSGEKALKVIDTSGKKLPNNRATPTTKDLYLEASGGNTTKNKGTATQKYQVKTTNQLTKMYTENTFHYVTSPNPSYINKLFENPSYTLAQLWVLKDGRSADSTYENDWDIYRDLSKVHFTNRGSIDGYITITDDTVIRLVYDTRSTTESFPADFYDYDISSGKNSDGTWRTGITGINERKNYENTTIYDSHSNVLAFGNDNTGTGLSRYKFDEVFLNKYSTDYKDEKGVKHQLDNQPDLFGCTFGIASGLRDGKIVYDPRIAAPKLFNDGDANGKTKYLGSSLGFSRVGDTYTLSTATVNSKSIDELEYFFHPSPKEGCIWDGEHSGSTWQSNILTNDFWPLDKVPAGNRRDPLLGSETARRYQGFTPYNYSGDTTTGEWKNLSGDLPGSDDGWNHNCFFGMNYAVKFTLTPDYVGPLEYYFFGDDDMWVFLDDQLVCDIGGVHSAVGEYVDLWDYMKNGDGTTKTGTHTLTFFYTERGASGSTCYMNFTLPSVSGVNTQQESGNLRVEKEVVGLDNGQDFEFTIQFFDEDGNVQPDDYSYTKHLQNGGTETDLVMHEGTIFTLKAGESIEVERLPYGIRYEITETDYSGSASGKYSTAWRTDEGITHAGRTATGSILKSAPDNISVVHFTNTATPNTNLNVKKVGPDGNALSGAAFTLTDSTGELVKFRVPETADGNYTVYHEELYPEIKEDEGYYIALASDPQWGIGKVDGKAKLKQGNSRQVFYVKHEADGSYSFRTTDNNWLNLSGDKVTTNGTEILIYNENNKTPPYRNELWYLLRNKDGSYRIQPKLAVILGTSAVVDMNTGIIQDGQNIQAYESNDTPAQKWKLVPVNPAEKPETTTTITVSSQGQLFLRDLIPGTYTLTESTAPGGYQKLTAPITFTVDRTGKITLAADTSSSMAEVSEDNLLLKVINQPQSRSLTLEKIVSGSDTEEKFQFEVEYTDVNGTSRKKTISLQNGHSETISDIAYGTTVKITEKDHAGFSVSYRMSYKNGEVPVKKSDSDSCSFTITDDVTITAVNSTGYELPSTGGGGTAWFTLAGLLLMTGAAALTILRRRAKEGGPE